MMIIVFVQEITSDIAYTVALVRNSSKWIYGAPDLESFSFSWKMCRLQIILLLFYQWNIIVQHVFFFFLFFVYWYCHESLIMYPSSNITIFNSVVFIFVCFQGRKRMRGNWLRDGRLLWFVCGYRDVVDWLISSFEDSISYKFVKLSWRHASPRRLVRPLHSLRSDTLQHPRDV